MRYKELDIARGFTVLLMPAVHLTMLYGNAAVYDSWWGIVLNWVATMPGAQLFMLLMGMSFAFSAAKKSANSILSKTARWFILSYALNFLKFIIPAIAGWLPPDFYVSLGLTPGITSNFRLFLVGDILQLAAFSLAFLCLIERFKVPNEYTLLIAAVLIVASPYLWNIHVTNPLLNEFLSLFTGNDPLVFFPIFPWFLYPLTGLLLGQSLIKGSLNYPWLSLAAIVLMLPEIVQHGFHFTLEENLYRPTSLQILYHLGFCFVWLSFCKYIASLTKNYKRIAMMKFCSKHITLIYCIQWIAIFWCIAIVPYRGLSIIETITLSILLSCIFFLLTYFIAKKHNPLLNQQQYG